MKKVVAPIALTLACLMLAVPLWADGILFDNGLPDGKMASGSRPATPGKIEIESADDFLFKTPVVLTDAHFFGLISGGADLTDVTQLVVEIYRVFPNDSVNPASGNVPTRTNSPSDLAFTTRDSAAAALTYTATGLGSFSAANSVLNGINKSPGQTTGGEGAVTGTEVEFDVVFSTPILLPADHYFFVPQVAVSGSDEFYWLSAPRPNPALIPDLQSWIRNENLAPDWLRIGTDIVGGSPPPTFNAAFSLTGSTVPEPSSLVLFGTGLLGLIGAMRSKLFP